MFRKISIIVLITSSSFFYNCKKKATTVVQDNIAYQAVNIVIYPNDPIYSASPHSIQYAGGWEYINGGVNGIIIYRQSTNNTPTDFIAIERTSTYLPDNARAAVVVLSNNITLKDTVSGSTWQVFNGSVTSGPATQNLRLYNATYDGLNTLTIRN